MHSILLALIIFFLPLYPLISNLFTILLIVLWIIEGKWKFKLKAICTNLYFFSTVALFFIFVTGLFFTEDVFSQLKQIEKRLGLLIFPLIIVSSSFFKSKYNTYIYHSFIFAADVLAIYTIHQIILKFNITGFVPIVGEEAKLLSLIHRPYMAYFCLISSTICFYYLLSKKPYKIFYFISYLISIIAIVLLVARSAIAILIVVHIYIVFKLLVNKRSFLKAFALAVFFVLVVVTGLLHYDRFTSRFKYLVQGKGEPRILIWNCSYKIITNPAFNPFLGVGNTSVTQDCLNHCYKKEYINKTYWSWVYKNNYKWNTHNEFINMYISFGILGLSTLLFCLIYLFIEAYKNDMIIFQGYIIIFSLSCLTENFLSRQWGIVSFAIVGAMILNNILGKKLDSKEL